MYILGGYYSAVDKYLRRFRGSAFMMWLCMKDLWASNGARIQRRLLKRSRYKCRTRIKWTIPRSQDYALSCITMHLFFSCPYISYHASEKPPFKHRTLSVSPYLNLEELRSLILPFPFNSMPRSVNIVIIERSITTWINFANFPSVKIVLFHLK